MCKIEANGQIKCDFFNFKNAKYFYLHEGPKVVKFIETESRMVIIGSWGEDEIRNYCLMCRDSVWKEEKALDREWWCFTKMGMC